MTRFAWFCLIALLAGPALWAQSDAAAGSGGAASGADSGSATAPAASSSQAATGGSSEDDFFGSGEVEAKPGTAEKQNAAEAIEVEKEKLGFSGQLQAFSDYTITRDYLRGSTGVSDNTFANSVMADFLVDARLPKSFRMFMDLNINYVPTGVQVPITFAVISPPSPPPGTLTVLQNQTTLLDIKEVFVDFNFANTVYFRAGKQVLQWGTGYFWNPTDLINIAHKSFTNLNALLDGVFGLRADVVFSPNFHLYTFTNLNEVQDITTVAYAARTEFLAGKVEFGFSGWYQYNKIPVFGTDITTPLFWQLNLTGEASVSWGDNQQKYDSSGTAYSVDNQLVPKVDVGLSRSFDAFDVQDRITVMAEFFWNSDGYNQNMFETLSPVPVGSPPVSPLQNFEAGYYHAGYYGQYYGALFITINSFFLSNLTLSLDGLANFSDQSAIAIVGLAYAPISNFTLQLQVGANVGADNREYTISVNPTSGAVTNNQLFAILSATVNF